MAIIELQQLGGPPEQILGLTNEDAAGIACCIVQGLLVGNGQYIHPDAFLVSADVTRIGWRNAASSHYVTVIWEG